MHYNESLNTLAWTCIGLMTLAIVIIFLVFTQGGKKDLFNPVTLKKLIIFFCPALFLLPPMIMAHMHKNDFKDREVSGKIVFVRDDPRTHFIVVPDSVDVALSFFAKGLSVGDSFYKPKNAELDFKFFKIDSMGLFHEIEFYPIDDMGTDTFRFK